MQGRRRIVVWALRNSRPVEGFPNLLPENNEFFIEVNNASADDTASKGSINTNFYIAQHLAKRLQFHRNKGKGFENQNAANANERAYAYILDVTDDQYSLIEEQIKKKTPVLGNDANAADFEDHSGMMAIERKFLLEDDGQTKTYKVQISQFDFCLAYNCTVSEVRLYSDENSDGYNRHVLLRTDFKDYDGKQLLGQIKSTLDKLTSLARLNLTFVFTNDHGKPLANPEAKTVLNNIKNASQTIFAAKDLQVVDNHTRNFTSYLYTGFAHSLESLFSFVLMRLSPAKEPEQKPENEPENLLLQEHQETKTKTFKDFWAAHWKKMLVCAVVGSLLVVAGVFTAGVVPMIAAGLGVGVAAAAGIGFGGAAAVGAIAGAGVGAIAGAYPSQEESGVKAFLKRHKWKILIGALVTFVIVGGALTGGIIAAVGVAGLGALAAGGVAATLGAVGVTTATAIGATVATAGVATISTSTGFLLGAIVDKNKPRKPEEPKTMTHENSDGSTIVFDKGPNDVDNVSANQGGIGSNNNETQPTSGNRSPKR